MEEIFFVQKELGGLHCEWDVDHQDMDKIDEMKHLPGGWIWKTFRCCYH